MKKNKNKKMQDHKRSYSKLPGSLEDRKANTKLSHRRSDYILLSLLLDCFFGSSLLGDFK
ncbi:unnamed protein product [Cuscuta epithymum]|uniref:Uncharacterized protein n=1 Tax=Cuscuta epithymum TaxID=186058 RepID=A0AAV0CBB9_9ASTE|nr:unnamed protein product [Cuscuta epithymum]